MQEYQYRVNLPEETVDASEQNLINAVKATREKRKKKRFVRLASVLTVAAFALTGCILFAFLGREMTPVSDGEEIPVIGTENGIAEDASSLPQGNLQKENEEMRGVWIASVININFPSKPALTQAELKAEIDDIVKNTVEAGLNTIFFQVRPTADSLYPSEIFPYSKYLTGTQGQSPDGGFDPLAYLLETAEKKHLDVHAWVNPYRVTMYESDEAELCATSPAVLHPEYTVKYADGKTYFNPGLPEVRTLVVEGVKELLIKYPTLDGVHFDDYFYPYPKADAVFDDAAAYETYGNGKALDDWRRENVNTLIKETYDAVKAIDPNVKFGVSPFGIWANDGSDTPERGSVSSGLEAYSALYCDALAWAKGGYVDYLIPQIYWSFATSAAPFDNIARFWNAALDGTDTDFYIGHAAYKAKEYAKNEIGIQVEFARNLLCYRGSVFYGYEDIKNNTVGLKDKLASLYKEPVVYKTPEKQTAAVNTPYNNYRSTSPTITLVGSSDVAYPLTVNGDKISRTKSGNFSYYSDSMTTGINVFTLEQNGVRTTHNIGYNTKRTSTGSSVATLSGLTITDIIPKGEAWVSVGDKLQISCVAPAGSTVTAKIGGMTVALKPTLNTTTAVPYAREIYTGSVTPSAFASEGEIVSLGTLMITAAYRGESTTATGGLIKQMGAHALVFAEVTKDYSHLKTEPTSSFYDDYTPASAGMRDYVTGLTGSFYKLKFGGYISADNVKIVEGVELNENKILDVKVAVNGTETVNNKNNFTDITFTCLENAVVNTVTAAGKIDITFYNTDSSLVPQPVITPNPLVSEVSAKPVDESTLTYTVFLKDEYLAFGYNVVYENGKIVLRLNNPQTLSEDPEKPLAGKTVVVDAGHGGNDTGALGCGKINEAALNLDIALHLQKELEAMGATVLMTRQDNTTHSLEERMVFLNDANPDLAVSVHQNSIAASANAQKIRGYLGLYCAEAGKLLAKTVSTAVTEDLNRYERPFAYQMLAVARNHRFPSTLCEMCFISNVEEYEWSITEGNTLRSAKAIARGIIDYYKAQEAYLAY